MRVLFIEPFDGGSHRAFLRTLTAGLTADHGVEATVLTLPARHWKWRMRGAAPWLVLSRDAELRGRYDLVFAGSYLALAELIGLCPALAAVPRILYFHENQAAYPDRVVPGDDLVVSSDDRDHHFAFTQIVSALAATRCVFNSGYNMNSFLDGSEALLRRMPDARLSGWRAAVAPRCEVLGVPLQLPVLDPGRLVTPADVDRRSGPVVLWNHRWEHDKNPDECFTTLERLAAQGVAFRLIVCGESYSEVPAVMRRAREVLGARILHWGFVADRDAYCELLCRADIVVSTAVHEFFGVAVLEATWCGARPLVPDRLAYPELFPAEYRYADFGAALRQLCGDWVAGEVTLRADRRALVAAHDAARVVPCYRALFHAVLAAGA